MSKLAVALGVNYPAGTFVTAAMMKDVRAIQADYAERCDNSVWRCAACGAVTEKAGRRYLCACDRAAGLKSPY